MARSGRPTSGVFLAWDEEAIEVARRDAGTVHDRTVVTARRTITKQVLWSNAVNARTIEAANRYVAEHAGDHENYRVQVFAKGQRP